MYPNGYIEMPYSETLLDRTALAQIGFRMQLLNEGTLSQVEQDIEMLRQKTNKGSNCYRLGCAEL